MKSSALGPWSIGYNKLYAVRNKIMVLKFSMVDAVLDLRLYIKNSYHVGVMLVSSSIWKTCCERLTPTLVYHYLNHDLILLQLLFFVHLLILEDHDHHHNLISSPLYYPGPLHEISSQSIHNFLSNVVHKQTTNATKNITSFGQGCNKVKYTLMIKWCFGPITNDVLGLCQMHCTLIQ